MTAEAVRAALAAHPSGTDAVEILGDGPLAHALRAEWPPAGDERPSAVVDTTGDVDRIAEALRRLDHLGVLVLAGPAQDGPVLLDLYTDVHVRGLTIVGVPPTA